MSVKKRVSTLDRIKTGWQLLTRHSFFSPASQRFLNPEASVGSWVANSDQIMYWTVTGEALDAWTALQPRLKARLETANLPESVTFLCYMRGLSQERAEPTVVIYGADAQSRKMAIKETNMLLNAKNPERKEWRSFQVEGLRSPPGYEA